MAITAADYYYYYVRLSMEVGTTFDTCSQQQLSSGWPHNEHKKHQVDAAAFPEYVCEVNRSRKIFDLSESLLEQTNGWHIAKTQLKEKLQMAKTCNACSPN